MSNKKSAKKRSIINTRSRRRSPDPTLVLGRFRPGSELAKMSTLLSDGKPRTIAEIARVVKPRSKKNIGLGKYTAIREWGKESRLFKLERTDGKIVMKNLKKVA